MVGHIRWSSAIATLPPFGNISLWVDFFFVLSGFVIAHSYFDRLQSGLGLATFMARRFARLYPLHLFTLLLAVAYEFAKASLFNSVSIGAEKAPFQSNNLPAFLANLGLVQALGLFPDVTWNGPSWSISVEFYTYLLFALLISTVRNTTAFLTLLAALPLGAAAILFTRPEQHFLSVETDYGFLRCILGFGLGVAVQRHLARHTQPAPDTGTTDLAKALLFAAILVLVATPTYKTPYTFLAPPLFAAFIWTLVRHRGGTFERLLASRTCQWLGLLSYSIYLNHSVFRMAFKNAWRLGQKVPALKSGPGAHLLNEGLTLAYIAVVLGFSWCTYRFLEAPAQRWLNARWDKLTRSRTPLSSPRPGIP